MTISKRAPPPQHLIQQLSDAVRRMGAQTVIASRTIADRFGLHTTDLEVLDLIVLRKTVSPSELANATGLTSGAVTALIDRLEQRGLVERRPDPNDRRRVLVRANAEAVAPIAAVYAGLQRRMFALWSQYSAKELALILDFTTRSTDLHVEYLRELQSEARAAAGAAPRTARRPHSSTD